MSSQNRHGFFLYFVNRDRHIFPQKNARGRKYWDLYCDRFLNVLDNKNGAFDIITEFKYISKMFIVRLFSPHLIKRYI